MTKISKRRQKSNRKKPKPSKKKETCSRRTESRVFGAPGHILKSFCHPFGGPGAAFRVNGRPREFGAKKNLDFSKSVVTLVSTRHDQDSPGYVNNFKSTSKFVPWGAQKQPKSETKQIPRNLDFRETYNLLNRF